MTIDTVKTQEHRDTKESVKVPIGSSGQFLSVTCLKDFFEKKAQEQEFLESRVSPPRRLSPPPVPPRPKNLKLSDTTSKCQEKGQEILTQIDCPDESPHKVHFDDEDPQSKESALKQRLQFDIRAIPSYKDLQESLTPRGTNTKISSPPPIRRGKSENLRRCSAPTKFSTPQQLRRNPLSSSEEKELSSSTGKIPVLSKKGGFSPRHRVSHIVPRSLASLSTTIDSPLHDKLKNDDWIEELPDVKKGVKSFNKSAFEKVKSHLEKKKIPKPSLETIKKNTKNFVKLEFDRILQSTNEFINDPLKTDTVGSPRSTMCMQHVLELVQTNGILTKELLLCITEMKKGLIHYLEKKKVKSEGTMRLANLLSYLMHYNDNLVCFMEQVDNITDKDTVTLLQTWIEDRLFNYLREFTGINAHNILRKDLAVIHLDFHDSLKIYTHKHYLWEPQDALVKFTGVNMMPIVNSFSNFDGLCLQNLTINKHLVDVKNLIGGGLDIRKSFFMDFLRKFYIETNSPVSQEELQQEVEQLLQNNDVPSKELLSLCVVPWKHFHEAIRLLYPGLQCGIVTLPNDEETQIHIDVEPCGTYRVIRSIKYITYQLKRRSSGSSHVPDRKKPIGTIEFVWTVTPCQNEKGAKTWSGCIQIPKAISITKDTPYELKWKMLRALIEYVDVKDQVTVSKLPLIEDPTEASEFDQEVYELFDRSEEFINYIQPSAFTLEFAVKNFCRECLLKMMESGESLDIDNLAAYISEELQVNGRVLEPLITRLSIFEEKLCRHLIIKSKRTTWIDNLLNCLNELLLSNKYAEFGIPVNKDLGTFLRIIEKDVKDSYIRQIILNVMCGRWNNFNGREDSAFQELHIGEIMGTLKYIRDSSKFIKPLLLEMIDDYHTISKDTILKNVHPWIEPEGKVSPISSISVQQIVRCFMQYTRPLFDVVTINGTPVDGSGLEGSVADRQKEYFKRLLRAIYSKYAPGLTEDVLEEQAAYMVDYESSDEEIKKLAPEKIHCLDLLRLCANSCWMVADIFFRNLFDLNDPPIKCSMSQGMSLIIEINQEGEFSVEHRRCYGVYPRETPDNISSNRIYNDRCLAKIPLSWKLSPYKHRDRLTTRGELRVRDVITTEGILPEYEAIIMKGLHNYHSDFRMTPNWEDNPKEPVLHMPLASPDGKRLPITSPRYKKPKTPR